MNDPRSGSEIQSGFQAQRITVLAGLPCAGKSYFLAGLETKDQNLVESVLGFEPDRPWVEIEAARIPAYKGEPLGQAVVHYDLHRQRVLNDFQHLAELFERAEQARVVTLWPSGAVLRWRLARRFGRIFVRLATGDISIQSVPKRLRTSWSLHVTYWSPGAMDRIRKDWIRFARRFPEVEWLVTQDLRRGVASLWGDAAAGCSGPESRNGSSHG